MKTMQLLKDDATRPCSSDFSFRRYLRPRAIARRILSPITRRRSAEEVAVLNHGKSCGWRSMAWILKYLDEQGHSRSVATMKPVDQDEKPLPWYTFPAIEYLVGIDWSKKRVLEFGSGYSSLFWAARAERVWSVENDEEWYTSISSQMPTNATVDLRCDKDSYISHAQQIGGMFDLIIVDGAHRLDCVRTCLPALADDGLLIFDNSDWHPQSTQYLREAGLIQIDFTGLGPINRYAWTTSIFITPQFRPLPANDRLPVWGVGALQQFASAE